MNKRVLIQILAGIVLLIFGVWLFEGRQIYAKVGDFKIYKKDIERRNKLIHMNYPNEKGDYGYKQLEDAYINYQIMRNHGYKKIEERLEKEVQRVEENSKNPELLAKIKKEIFNGDNGSFRRAYIFPAAIDEEIFFGYYMNAAGIHDQSLKAAQNLLEEIKTDRQPLQKIAEARSLVYGMIEANRAKGVRFVDKVTFKPIDEDPMQTSTMNDAYEKQKPDSVPGKRKKFDHPEAVFWLDTILKDLKAGEVISQPISQDEFWYIGRLVKREGGNAIVELITVPKISFSQLVEEEKKQVPIRTGFFLF